MKRRIKKLKDNKTTGNATTEEKISEWILSDLLKNGVMPIEQQPRLIEVTTEKHADGVIYDGKIVIEDSGRVLRAENVEGILHSLKHCFKGDYEKVPDWMVSEFRAQTEKHSRIGITYTMISRDHGRYLEITFRRSMGRGVSGACQLCKVPLIESIQTEQEREVYEYTLRNALGKYATVIYNSSQYFAVPLVVYEANRLMVLFEEMAIEAIDAYILEQVLGHREVPAPDLVYGTSGVGESTVLNLPLAPVTI